MERSTHTRAVYFMVLSTFLFGVMNVIVKFLDRLPSHELVLFRSLVMFSITLVMLQRAKINPFVWKPRWILIGRGVAGSMALMIYFYTIQRLPLASAVTLGYLSPIFTIIFASYLLKESMRFVQWLFFILSFSGIVMMHGFDTGKESWLVLLGILGAAFSGLALYNALLSGRQSGLRVLWPLLESAAALRTRCAGGAAWRARWGGPRTAAAPQREEPQR